jgi:hypothetical protein
MPLPSSGQISFSQITQIIKGSLTAQLDLNEAETRYLANKTSGAIKFSDFYEKPASGGFTVSTPTYVTNTDYTFLCPAFQYMTTTCNGPGGGGGGGDNHNVYGYGNNGNDGGAGVGNTVFSFPGFSMQGNPGSGGGGNAGGAVAPAGSGSSTGSFATITTGGGAAGGSSGSPQQGGVWGGVGGAGGKANTTFTHGTSTYFATYGSTISIRIGAGGFAGTNAGAGGDGSVVVTYS